MFTIRNFIAQTVKSSFQLLFYVYFNECKYLLAMLNLHLNRIVLQYGFLSLSLATSTAQ